jgi:hypothetical protein
LGKGSIEKGKESEGKENSAEVGRQNRRKKGEIPIIKKFQYSLILGGWR